MARSLWRDWSYITIASGLAYALDSMVEAINLTSVLHVGADSSPGCILRSENEELHPVGVRSLQNSSAVACVSFLRSTNSLCRAGSF
jgi:hypothetical protein